VQAQTDDKCCDKKDSSYEKLECVFDQNPEYHLKMLLGDFSKKAGREGIFIPRTKAVGLE
jgi:hypothetical protein